MSEDAGSAVTVEGRIDAEEVGVTLPHEHIFIDSVDWAYEPPGSAIDRRISEEPIRLDNLWWIRKNRESHKDSLRMNSFPDAVEEIKHFLHAGGDTLVDLSPKSFKNKPEEIRAVSRATGINVIHGTAFYYRPSHPHRLDDMSLEEIAEEFERDITEGIDGTDVRAGIIGEIGLSDTSERDEPGINNEIYDAEEKVLRASARAAIRTGAPINVHPPYQRSEEWPNSRRCHSILDILEEEGLPLERVVLSHRDRSKWLETDLTHQMELADRGAYIEYDMFGHEEVPHPEFNDAKPSDFDRIKWVMELIENGYGDSLLLSHDVFRKSHLRKYGGYGYAHVIEDIIPILKEYGVSKSDLDELVIDNPRRLLTFAEPE
jgi:phosphotriesterase-related protein